MIMFTGNYLISFGIYSLCLSCFSWLIYISKQELTELVIEDKERERDWKFDYFTLLKLAYNDVQFILHVSEALVYILSIMEVFIQLYKPVPLYLVKYLCVLLHASDIFCVMSPFSSLSFKYLNCGLMVLFACLQLFSYHTRFLLFTQVTNCTNDSVPKYLVCDADKLGIIFTDFVFSFFLWWLSFRPLFFFWLVFPPLWRFFLFYLYYISHNYYPFI